MANVLTVINQKGGVGKTATATNMAFCLALRGKRTLIIDLDPSANATRVFRPCVHGLTVREFLLDQSAIETCVLPCEVDGEAVNYLSMIPSHIKLALAHKEISNRLYREQLLAKKLALIKNHFDYVIIDCAPTLSDLTINALYASDFMLIPVRYEKDALEGVADLFDVIDAVKESKPYAYRILRNGYDARKRTVNTYIDEQLQVLIKGRHVCETVIPQDENVNKAKIEDLPVELFNKRSGAAHAYQLLADEIERIFY